MRRKRPTHDVPKPDFHSLLPMPNQEANTNNPGDLEGFDIFSLLGDERYPSMQQSQPQDGQNPSSLDSTQEVYQPKNQNLSSAINFHNSNIICSSASLNDISELLKISPELRLGQVPLGQGGSSETQGFLQMSQFSSEDLRSRLANLVQHITSMDPITAGSKTVPSIAQSTQLDPHLERVQTEGSITKQIEDLWTPLLHSSGIKEEHNAPSSLQDFDVHSFDPRNDRPEKRQKSNSPSNFRQVVDISEIMGNETSQSALALPQIAIKERIVNLAEAVAMIDQELCQYRLSFLKKDVNARGTPIQRVANYLVEGLIARLNGNGSQLWNKPVLGRQTELLEAMNLFASKLPFLELSMVAMNDAIIQACRGAKTLHIVDFAYYLPQWPNLMRQLVIQPGGPPNLRITSVDTPTSSIKRAMPNDLQRILKAAAARLHINLQFRQIKCEMQDLDLSLLELRAGEDLAVNCGMRLHQLADSSVIRHSPRDRIIQKIREWVPRVMTMTEIEGDLNGVFFMSRFKEALNTYLPLFEAMDEGFPRDCPKREIFEQEIFGRDLINIVACEGSERVSRAETFAKWQARLKKACFTQVSHSSQTVASVRRLVENFSKNFSVIESEGALKLAWKGQPVLVTSVWSPVYG